MWRSRIEAQPMFDVLELANERESKGNYVARMEIGDTPGFRNELIHELIGKYAKSNYRYSPSQGEQILREKVIQSEWPNELQENVVIGPANFLITASLAACTSENDYILLPDPGFPTYYLAAKFLGLRPIYYSVFNERTSALPDFDTLIKELKIRPTAIIVNNPSNPLGVAIPGDEIAHKLRIFDSLGIAIILDETYANLIYDQTNPVISGIKATRIRTFSKEHCAPGIRVGYVVSDSGKTKTISDFISMSISCVPSFIQFAVAEYLSSDLARNFVENVKIEMKQRLTLLTSSLPSQSIKHIPNSAYYALLNVGDGDACFRFLLQKNIATCPGGKFGENSKDSIRVSLAGSALNFEKDVKMLSEALSEWFEIVDR